MEGYVPVYYNQLVMCTLIYNTGFGRPWIKLDLCPGYDLQLRHGKRGLYVIPRSTHNSH